MGEIIGIFQLFFIFPYLIIYSGAWIYHLGNSDPKSLDQSIYTPLQYMPSKNENDFLKIVGVTMFEMVLGGLKYRLSGKCQKP